MVTGLLLLPHGSNRHHKGPNSSVHSNDFLAFMSRSPKTYFSFNFSKEFSKFSQLPLHIILLHILSVFYGKYIYFRVIYKFKVPNSANVPVLPFTALNDSQCWR